MTITGPGADVITISGNDASRIFEIINGTAVITSSISGLALTDGLGTGGTGGTSAGYQPAGQRDRHPGWPVHS